MLPFSGMLLCERSVLFPDVAMAGTHQSDAFTLFQRASEVSSATLIGKIPLQAGAGSGFPGSARQNTALPTRELAMRATARKGMIWIFTLRSLSGVVKFHDHTDGLLLSFGYHVFLRIRFASLSRSGHVRSCMPLASPVACGFVDDRVEWSFAKLPCFKQSPAGRRHHGRTNG